MSAKCSVPNCTLQSGFTFHSPRSRPHLELWKKILGMREDNFYVCDQHFEEKFLRVEKRLTVDAFPTQFIADIVPGSEDFCQCCLKSFVRSRLLSQNEIRHPIDGTFKEIALDIVGIELANGVACSKCFDYIRQFNTFRKALREKQTRREEILAKSQLDLAIKIKEEPQDDYEDQQLHSVIDVQQESFGELPLEIKEEVIEEEERVVVKQEPAEDTPVNFLISEIKTEPEQIQPQRIPAVTIRRVIPGSGQRVLIKKPPTVGGGIIVKSVNLRNLKIMPAPSTQKFQIIRSPQQPLPQQQFKTITNQHPTLATPSAAFEGYKCQYCPNRFVERRFVVNHIKQKHAFQCNLCPSVFPFKITLMKHQIALHGVNSASLVNPKNTAGFRFPCTVCACRFSTSDNLEIHMRQKHGSVVKKEREEKSDENVAIIKHMTPSTSFQINQTTIRPRPVTTLVKKILKPANISPAVPETMQEDPDGIPCLDCGLLLRPDKLLKHRMDAHSLNTHNLYYLCDLCGLEVKGKTQLINHMTNKHLAKYFVKCEFCEGLFANETEVICHKNLQHNFNGTRFTCHFCNKIFSNKRDMILHRKQHYSEKESRERLARIFCKKFKSYEPKSEEY